MKHRAVKKSFISRIIVGSVVCLIIGGLSGYATAGSIGSWYSTLNKPFFNPPNWIFGPVWTVLYILMGASAGIIWDQGWNKPEVIKALGVFGIHMLLNAAWTLIFFGMEAPLFALIEIFLLWISILIYARIFYKIKAYTGWMQIPYLLWVSFASVLNGAIVWLN